jgi:CRISPR-associated protein Csm4
MTMKTYRLTLRTTSGTATPFQADTIFGHLCWMVERRDGKEGLSGFLEPFLSGSPPFLVSDGFPAGWIAKPASISQAVGDQALAKRLKRQSYVTVTGFNAVRGGGRYEPDKGLPGVRRETTVHNSIDRESGRTLEEGGLFQLEEWAIPEVAVYVKASSEEWRARVLELFNLLSHGGYGKKKAIGKGQFRVECMDEAGDLEAVPKADGFVSLSSFCPAAGDPSDGWYQTFVKHGKLGEDFTYCGNPFKRPLLMLRTGAAFRTGGPPKDFYGRMVAGVSPARPEAVQYAYAFAVPAKCPK